MIERLMSKQGWEQASRERREREFCWRNFLSGNTMKVTLLFSFNSSCVSVKLKLSMKVVVPFTIWEFKKRGRQWHSLNEEK